MTEDDDRLELRQRAIKGAAEEPANDFMKGWRAAWMEVLRVMNDQDKMRNRING